MSFQALGTGLTTVTNPDPNTISTKPFRTQQGRNNPTFDPAWAALPQFALFPVTTVTGRLNDRLSLHFKPSSAGATFTIIVWFWNPLSNTWVKPQNGATVSYTGEVMDYINSPPATAIFPQISALSAGTLDIYYDSDYAIRG